jgi:ketosteroid isomerase-like protein
METIETVQRFNDALNAGDLPAMLALLTSDTVFENTHPPPDGTRYAGRAAVGAFWEGFLRSAREQRIEVEEIFAAGERCVMRWIYHWRDAAGAPGHIRGVDVYTVRGGLIAEKLSYVKG